MAKICVVNIQAEEIAGLFTYYAEEGAAKVLRPGSSIGIKCPDPGVMRITDSHPYFRFLNTREIVEKIIEADREGYDAAVVHCFGDPGVREARGVVNIPVIGAGEPTLLYACNLGDKFAILSLNDAAAKAEVELVLERSGLRSRAIAKEPVRPMELPFREFARKSPQEAAQGVLPDLLAKARECVADGADVVVLGCTGVGPLATIAGVGKLDSEDGREVPLLDSLAVAIKMAELMVEMREGLGLPAASRARIWALPREKDFHRVRELFGLRSLAPDVVPQ